MVEKLDQREPADVPIPDDSVSAVALQASKGAAADTVGSKFQVPGARSHSPLGGSPLRAGSTSRAGSRLDRRHGSPNRQSSCAASRPAGLETMDDDADAGAPAIGVPRGGSDFDTKAVAWHTHSTHQVSEFFGLGANALDRGAEDDEVAARRKLYGDNIIPLDGGRSVILMFLSHFINSIAFILAIVAGISVYFGDWAEFGVVVFVIVFNGLVGFWQEYSAEKSIQGLKDMTAGSAKVIRSGRVHVVELDEVTVGDVVLLEQGASVPADIRLLEANNLEVDEALLTGEALPVTKHVHRIDDQSGDCALGDRKNMAFRKTLVTSGVGRGIVTAGGQDTEMGKISKALTSNSGPSETPLQTKMKHMMWALFGVCFILAVIVFLVNGGWWDFDSKTILYAAAVAIAVLPEALVAVITVAMTISVRRMAAQKCIVRKLAALEVLGNVTDICSDKTGTLTENKMVVSKMYVGDRVIDVGGAPRSLHGVFSVKDEDLSIAQLLETNATLARFMQCAALCSATVLHREEDTVVGQGNPTEIAIQAMTWKARRQRDYFQDQEGFADRGEFPFDSTVKRMSSGYLVNGQSYVCCKGASERVLELCEKRYDSTGVIVPMKPEALRVIEEQLEALASLGLRTLCLAERDSSDGAITLTTEPLQNYPRDVVESNLVFLGIVGIYDPPRPESRPSVHVCQGAGITVRMLTGDHASTATAIARHLNISKPSDIPNPYETMTGPAFDRMSLKERDELNDLPSVVGRCSPDSKVNMIEALHKRGRVVAMTGDGFNDSPSIKIADIGCAMGSGTDVTKGVADLVITDDNFATIVKAVAEGRRIAASITKFVIHLLSGNVAEVIVLVLGLPFRYNGRSIFILSPIEILWLNMFTGSPPAMGLSLDEASDDILHMPPNTDGFFTWELLSDTFLYGFFLGTSSLASFAVVLYGFNDGPAGEHCNESSAVGCENIWTARSTAFCVLYLGLYIHAYNVRHQRVSIFRMKWFDNKWLWGSCAFGVIALIPIQYVPQIAKYVFIHQAITWHWGVVIVALSYFLLCSEVYKIVKNRLFPITQTHLAPVAVEAAEEEMVGVRRHMGHDNRTVEEMARDNVKVSNIAAEARLEVPVPALRGAASHGSLSPPQSYVSQAASNNSSFRVGPQHY